MKRNLNRAIARDIVESILIYGGIGIALYSALMVESLWLSLGITLVCYICSMVGLKMYLDDEEERRKDI